MPVVGMGFPIVHQTVAVKRTGRRCLKFNQWGFECYAGSGGVSEWSVASVHCVASSEQRNPEPGDSVTGGSFLLRHQTRRRRLWRSWERGDTSRNLPVFIEQGMFCHQLGWALLAGRSWRESESEGCVLGNINKHHRMSMMSMSTKSIEV